jgi:antirestriction protein ArdC
MQYLAAWLKILKADSHAIWKAAAFAESASKELGRRFGIAHLKEDSLVQHS